MYPELGGDYNEDHDEESGDYDLEEYNVNRDGSEDDSDDE